MTTRYLVLLIVLVPAACALADAPSLEGEIQRIGAWPYGSSSAVDVDGHRPLVYLGSGGGILVLDVSDPENPVLVSDTLQTAGVVLDIFYDDSDSLLYAGCDNAGMEIWDMSDPVFPEQLSSIEILYFGVETPVGNVDISGGYAVAECNFGGVHTIDVSDPANPQQVAFNAAMGNPALSSEVDSSGTVHTTGAQYYMRLTINPDGSINSAGQKEFLYGAGTASGNDEVAYVSYGGNLYILDLLVAGFPAWSITDVGGFSDIAERGDLIFLVNGDGLQVWDVSNYSAPFLVGTVPQVPDYADRIVLKEDYAYVTNSHYGLAVIDISDPSDPQAVGSYDVPSISWAVELDGDFAYVAHSDDGLMIFDVSDPGDPDLLGQSDTDAEARDVDLNGGFACLAAWTDGLRVIDVSNPVNPFEVGSVDDIDAWRVRLDGSVAWVVEAVPNMSDTLRSYDVSVPGNPIPMGSAELYGLTWELEINGDVLYVASGDDGLRILDISDPYAPQETGFLDLPSVFDLQLIDANLYVTCADGFEGGLFIYNVDDPDSPSFVGSYEQTGFTPWHTGVQGGWAMVLESDEMALIDVSDPASPQLVDQHEVPGFLLAEIICREAYAYVCAGDAGLQVYENTLYTGIGSGDESAGLHVPRLGTSRPNPFRVSTAIGYTLPVSGSVRLAVYDTRGALVDVLVEGYRPAGSHQSVWDGIGQGGTILPSGVYLYRLDTEEGSASGSMVLLR